MATNASARGQISFIDLNDGKSLSLYLTSNHATTQLYNLDTGGYVPDYATNNLVISPQLFVSGMNGNQIAWIQTTPHWTINGVDVNTAANPNTPAASCPQGVTFSISENDNPPYALTISRNNIVGTPQMTIACVANFVDPDTSLTTTISATITITQLETAEGLLQAVAYAVNNTIFYNEEQEAIKIHCDLWRGNDDDNTLVGYQWYRKDDPVGADAYDWHKIVATLSGDGGTAATGTFPNGETWKEVEAHGIEDYTTDEVSITTDDIVNYDVFMCVCTDLDPDLSSYNQQFRSNIVSIMDWSDPYYLDFVSPAGTVLTAGTASVDTKVHVWCRGEEVSDTLQNGNTFHYLWTKTNKLGVLATGQDLTNPEDYKASNNSGGADSSWSRRADPSDPNETVYCKYGSGETARELTVYKNEVKTKCTFFVELYID